VAQSRNQGRSKVTLTRGGDRADPAPGAATLLPSAADR
jgi:hypothetical protein